MWRKDIIIEPDVGAKLSNQTEERYLDQEFKKICCSFDLGHKEDIKEDNMWAR